MHNLGYVALLVATSLVPAIVLLLMRPDRITRRGPNTFIGIRTRATMASDAAWARGHEVAWPLVRLGSVVTIVLLLGGAVVVALAPAGLEEELPSFLVIGALVLWMVFVLTATVAAHRAAGQTGALR